MTLNIRIFKQRIEIFDHQGVYLGWLSRNMEGEKVTFKDDIRGTKLIQIGDDIVFKRVTSVTSEKGVSLFVNDGHIDFFEV